MKLSILLFLFFFCITCNFSAPKSELTGLKTGDIVLVKNKSWISDKIVSILNEEQAFSHAGIIVKETSKTYVVHSSPENEGIAKTILSKFIRFTDSILVLRPKLLINDPSDQLNDYLNLNASFDHELNDKTVNSFYCTELLSDFMFHVVGRQWQVKYKDCFGKQVILFASFYNSEHLEVVNKYDAMNVLIQ